MGTLAGTELPIPHNPKLVLAGKPNRAKRIACPQIPVCAILLTFENSFRFETGLHVVRVAASWREDWAILRVAGRIAGLRLEI